MEFIIFQKRLPSRQSPEQLQPVRTSKSKVISGTKKKFFLIQRVSAMFASQAKTQLIIIIIYPSTVRVAGAPQMFLQPVSSIFPCSPLPSGTWRTQACPFPDVVFLPLLLSALSSSPFHFTVPCNTVLARPHEQEMSIRLHFVSLYDGSLNACWILAWTPLLVTCSLYEMCSILRSTSFSWLVFFFAALL